VLAAIDLLQRSHSSPHWGEGILPHGTQRSRVLIIEDEQDLASLVQVNLELAGYEALLASDGAEGLAYARRTKPDLILLDVMMPVLDGWQVLRALKDEPGLQDIPVIMLTALGEERDIIRGNLQGALRYLTKPFEMRALLDAIEEGLREPTEAEQLAQQDSTKKLLTRLAELESGRQSADRVRVSRLEPVTVVTTMPNAPNDAERARVHALTEKQRHIAEAFALGRSASDLADELDVSRSNVYATRKRIARKLGVPPGNVPQEARRLGLGQQPSAG
jgi:DNA-binding response OmpR family regulator